MSDESAYNTIDGNHAMETVGQKSTLPLEGIVRSVSIGTLLHGLYGSSTVDTTNDPVHTFTAAQSNHHPTYTVYDQDPIGTRYATLGMIQSLQLNLTVDEYVTFNTDIMAGKVNDGSAFAYSAPTDTRFLPTHAQIYVDSTLAGLDSATPSDFDSASLARAKNLMEYKGFGTDEYTKRFNQKMVTTGTL